MIRLITAVVLGYTTLVSAFTSSIFSTATRVVATEFGVSTEVGLLGLSFYVLGFALGPLFWAPFSELKGRRLPLVIGMFGFSIFQIGVAVGKDLQTVLLCRLWGGRQPLSPIENSLSNIPRNLWSCATSYRRSCFFRHV